MSKNANKKPKFKPIVFEIQKSRFKKVLKNALAHISSYSYGDSVLNGINFKIEGEKLTLASTDGNTLIKQELAVDEMVISGNYQLTLHGLHLYKAQFKNSYEAGRKRSLEFLDKLRFTINENSAIIEDLLNKIQYVIPAIEYNNFPEYEKLIPNLEKTKIIQKLDLIRA